MEPHQGTGHNDGMSRLLWLCVVLLGCGGPLDSNFTGIFTGTGVVTMHEVGGAPMSTATTFKATIAVQGNKGTYAGLCRDSTALVFEGSGSEVKWPAAFFCPTPIDGCDTAGGTYRNTTLRMDGRDRLIASFDLEVYLCTTTYLGNFVFDGRK